RVLQTLAPIEKEVQDTTGRWHLRRILPYRTEDDRIDGVVLTFLDITRQKEDAESLRVAARDLEERVQQRTEELGVVNESLRTSIRQREQLEKEVAETAEEQRQQLGRELHDTL